VCSPKGRGFLRRETPALPSPHYPGKVTSLSWQPAKGALLDERIRRIGVLFLGGLVLVMACGQVGALLLGRNLPPEFWTAFAATVGALLALIPPSRPER